MMNHTQSKQALLKKHFGYDAFREGQESVIDAILAGRDALCVMPTGAGKSVCYQIPALMFPGITLVVSPLISLMKDQVSALKFAGVPAAYLNSSLTPGQYRKALANAEEGMYKIIYIAPERLETQEFRAFAAGAHISLIAVDEAHCVSQWGQDFRPSYLGIRGFVEALQNRPIVASFTATATSRVREDIGHMLALRAPFRLVTGFNRPNLFFDVRPAKNKEKPAMLLSLLDEMPGKSGIVYCGTRKNVDEVASLLSQHGFLAARYHAGMDDAERRVNQDAFAQDEKSIMVATNAFGMGIDKSNVSFVIHYNMPKDVESYYQEAGRAGRDGLPARCILLYSKQDVVLCNFLIERSFESEEMSAKDRGFAVEQAKQRLAQMTFFATGHRCLRFFLLRYFGEEAAQRCGSCSSCVRGTERDITDVAGIILACVRDTGERYGIATIVGILTGSKQSKIIARGLDRGQFAALSQMKPQAVSALIDAMLAEEYLSASQDAYRTLARGRLAVEIENGLPCVVRVPDLPAAEEKPAKPVRAAKSEKAIAASSLNQPLYERLARLRLEIARVQKVPAYIVFSNTTLEAMSQAAPMTRAEMMAVSGVGEKKWEVYGEAFLEEIRRFLAR